MHHAGAIGKLVARLVFARLRHRFAVLAIRFIRQSTDCRHHAFDDLVIRFIAFDAFIDPAIPLRAWIDALWEEIYEADRRCSCDIAQKCRPLSRISWAVEQFFNLL